jgi:hypothetical protein
MAQYTYAGDFSNPTEDFVVQGPNEEGQYWIGVKAYCECGYQCCSRPQTGVRPHDNGLLFDDFEQAYDWIEGVEEFFEQDYDSYLEENRHAIVQMERYEQWRNEY